MCKHKAARAAGAEGTSGAGPMCCRCRWEAPQPQAKPYLPQDQAFSFGTPCMRTCPLQALPTSCLFPFQLTQSVHLRQESQVLCVRHALGHHHGSDRQTGLQRAGEGRLCVSRDSLRPAGGSTRGAHHCAGWKLSRENRRYALIGRSAALFSTHIATSWPADTSSPLSGPHPPLLAVLTARSGRRHSRML